MEKQKKYWGPPSMNIENNKTRKVTGPQIMQSTEEQEQSQIWSAINTAVWQQFLSVASPDVTAIISSN